MRLCIHTNKELHMHQVHSMAYVGETPWHGLGRRLTPHQPLEVWAQQAGMDWRIEAADVHFIARHPFPGSLHKYPDQKVLFRSDTKAPLSIVSSRFKVVQPAEMLEFYRDLTEIGGYELETAGVLKGGRKLWALARTHQSVTLKGGDTVNGYLLLATACDGTLATTAQFTSVRVVCNNTLAIALRQGVGAVRVPHRSEFDAQAVKQQLGIAIAPWSAFEDYIKELANRRVADKTVERFLVKVFAYPVSGEQPAAVVNEHAIRKVQALYGGQGLGAALPAAKGTAWGLLNSITEYVDHHRRAHSNDHRRNAAWFGQGALLKQRAWEEALKLVA
jgi:phage/plasmid-like protein (TIGR03299 family)